MENKIEVSSDTYMNSVHSAAAQSSPYFADSRDDKAYREGFEAGAGATLQSLFTLLLDIKKRSRWAYDTIDEGLTFGLDEEQAVYSRERRCKGVLLDTVKKIDGAIK